MEIDVDGRTRSFFPLLLGVAITSMSSSTTGKSNGRISLPQSARKDAHRSRPVASAKWLFFETRPPFSVVFGDGLFSLWQKTWCAERVKFLRNQKKISFGNALFQSRFPFTWQKRHNISKLWKKQNFNLSDPLKRLLKLISAIRWNSHP